MSGLSMTTQVMSRASNSGLTIRLADARDERDVGGKACNLARLIALGAPVPDGVVLSRHALDLLLERYVPATGGDARETERTAEGMRAIVMAVPLPAELALAIASIATEWTGPLAVRSSAIGEDGSASSFAGQFDSVLGVSSRAELERAVRTCWASLWSERALAYRRARGMAPRGMGVVVQRQVDAAVAGVLFTRHPEVGHAGPDDMVLEYCAGLADRLVAGAIDPGRVEVSRASLAISTRVPPPDGWDPRAERLLTERTITALARLALRLETALGGPQDIEWAIDRHGHIAIVQARPITSGMAKTPNPSPPPILWSNANINENFPQPVSPFLYSIAVRGYYHYFRNLGLAFGVSRRRIAAMDRPLRGIIGIHAARMYYNLTNIHAVLRMAPFGERLARAFNLFVGVDRMADPPEDATAWSTRRGRLTQAAEAVRMAVAVTWQYAFLERRLERFERAADAFVAATSAEALRDARLPALGALLARFLDIRFHGWKNAGLCDTAAMVTFALLERLLARNGFGQATHTRLLRALPGVPSSRPPIQLWTLSRLAREDAELHRLMESEATAATILETIRLDRRFEGFARAFQAYLDAWGFRSSCELMMTVPTLAERPEPVIELLRQYVRADGEPPAAVIARQAAERQQETRDLLWTLARRAPLQALATWLVLRATQRSVAYRERARLEQALLYTRCRRLALHIGDELTRRGQLSARDDVFMLTVEEVEALTAGRAMFAERLVPLVALRQHEHAALSRLNPPDSFTLPEGTAYSARDDAQPVGGAAPLDVATALHGTSACGGRVTARAAVLGDVGDAHRLRRGDVLVTRQTDPGWAPVFCLISGLVIERGGMLSHGAIIAREFGLPCIVGVKRATERIPHGARLTVDGDRGTCAIEEEQ